MINQAHQSIDIGAFYLNNKTGQALEPVLQAIIKAAKRGVKVHIVIESTMRSQSQQAVNLLKKHSEHSNSILTYAQHRWRHTAR